MTRLFKKIVGKILSRFGYQIISNYKMSAISSKIDAVIDGDIEFERIYNKCKKYTMTSRESMYALYQSVKYIVSAKIEGEFTECGVWKGGNTMLIAYTLQSLGQTNRKIYCYDTFSGMTKPGKEDFGINNGMYDLVEVWNTEQKDGQSTWCISSQEEVEQNMSSTGYPKENIIFVKGMVEDTIPNTTPEKIALLRLDTDWYESTKHELTHLFPLLSKNGVLIIDDYGCWAGSKKATDEYLQDKSVLLNRIDSGVRLAIKTTRGME